MELDVAALEEELRRMSADLPRPDATAHGAEAPALRRLMELVRSEIAAAKS